MKQIFHQFYIITQNELSDAVHSYRAIVTLALFMLVSLGCSYMFIDVLQDIETELNETVEENIPFIEPATVTETFWNSKMAKRILTRMLGGDERMAESLMPVPPLALFFAFSAYLIIPMMVIIISSNRIAEEVSSASVRYVLFRVDRCTWCAGKYAGQAIMLLLAILASSFGAWLVGVSRLNAFDWFNNGYYLTIYSFNIWIYSLAYLGLALGISQLTRSPIVATVLGMVGLILVFMISSIARFFERVAGEEWAHFWSNVRFFTPQGNVVKLWNPDPIIFMQGVVALLALSMAFFFLGHLFFARRDQ